MNSDNVFNICKTTLKTIGGCILFIALIAIFLASICKLTIIKVFYKLWYSKPFNILWGGDAVLQYQGHSIFAPQENASMSYVAIRMRGRADIYKWRKRMMENVIDLPKSHDLAKSFAAFKKLIVRKHGYYVWEEDPNFSIEDHVRLHPETYDTDKALTKILTDLTQQPYPKGHSPWELILIRKQQFQSNCFQVDNTEDNEYVCAFRVHHSIVDGSLITCLIANFCDESTRSRFDGKIVKYYIT